MLMVNDIHSQTRLVTMENNKTPREEFIEKFLGKKLEPWQVILLNSTWGKREVGRK